MFKFVVLCLAVFAVYVQADTELSPIAKECILQTHIEVSAVQTYISGGKIPEDDELAQKFFACVFGDNINDSNEVIITDKVKGLARKILSDRLGSDFEDLDGVSFKLLSECSDLKGDNKGLTAIRVTNCYGKKITDLQSY